MAQYDQIIATLKASPDFSDFKTEWSTQLPFATTSVNIHHHAAKIVKHYIDKRQVPTDLTHVSKATKNMATWKTKLSLVEWEKWMKEDLPWETAKQTAMTDSIHNGVLQSPLVAPGWAPLRGELEKLDPTRQCHIVKQGSIGPCSQYTVNKNGKVSASCVQHTVNPIPPTPMKT